MGFDAFSSVRDAMRDWMRPSSQNQYIIYFSRLAGPDSIIYLFYLSITLRTAMRFIPVQSCVCMPRIMLHDAFHASHRRLSCTHNACANCGVPRVVRVTGWCRLRSSVYLRPRLRRNSEAFRSLFKTILCRIIVYYVSFYSSM